MENWISPNTIAGPPAKGSQYIHRIEIERDFWKSVRSNAHVLFVAPRRVGKTSVMQYIEQHSTEGYICLYENIESVKSKDELFKRIFEMVLKCAGTGKKATTWLGKMASKYRIEEISVSGSIKFSSSNIDFCKELLDLLDSFKEVKENIVLFLDEFPETINKLIKADKHDEARDILHTLRELRHDKRFKHFTLVIAGSIGLQYLIKKIDRPKLINDIYPLHIDPLTDKEAKALIKQLTAGATMQYDAQQTSLLLKKIGYYLPYYIQLMLDEIDRIGRKNDNEVVDSKAIDNAFDNIIRNHKNFEDWLTRLKDTYQEDYDFINEVLSTCAYSNQLAIQQIANIAASYKLQTEYTSLLDDLCADGYLTENENRIYRFISPFLQNYWMRKFPKL